MAWKYRLVCISVVAVIGVGAGVACSPGLDAEEFCTELCTNYLPCVSADDHDVRLPLFCPTAESQQLERCVSECSSSLDALGESREKFAACAECVMPFVGEEICDDTLAYQTGMVSCASACDDSQVEAAAGLFFGRFDPAIREPAAPSYDCTDAGTLTFAPTDERLEHRTGAASADGGWICDENCDCDHMIYGPYVTLPAGTYTAMVRIDGTVPDGESLGLFDVHTNETDEVGGSQPIDAAALAGGSISIDFTLPVQTKDMEFRTRFCHSGPGTLEVEAITLTRR